MRHVVILAAVFVVFYFLARETAYYGPYIYDEADYMYAVGLGWKANWLDSPSMPLSEFIRIGRSRDQGSAGRAELSETIRNSGDVLFYRHWHGPLYIAWLALSERLVSGERPMRSLSRIIPIAVALLIYGGSLWVLPGVAGEVAAIVGTVLYLWGFPVVRSPELAPHQWFAGCVIAALLLLAKLWDEARLTRAYWYGAVVMTAAAFCLLEVAFALVLTMLICGYATRVQLKPDFAFAARSIGAFAGTILILWPGAVFKLSFIKSYLFMAYLALFRSGSWGNDISVGETWRLRFVNSPVPWIVFLVAVVFFATHWRKERVLMPFAIFSALMFVAIWRVNTDLPRYILPMLPGAVLLGAFSIGRIATHWSGTRRIATVLLICVAMFFTSWPGDRAMMPVPNRGADTMLALVRQATLAQQTVLVPHIDIPMLHYYFPQARFKTYYEEDEIPQQIRSGTVDTVLYRSHPIRLVPVASGRLP